MGIQVFVGTKYCDNYCILIGIVKWKFKMLLNLLLHQVLHMHITDNLYGYTGSGHIPVCRSGCVMNRTTVMM